MKILLASPFTSTSGSAIRFWNIAAQLRAQGFTVVYTDRSKRGAEPLYRVDGIVYSPSRTFSPLVLDILFSTVYTIALLLRHLDCRIFYALKPAPNNCCAALIARLLGKKIILDIDDLDYEYIRPGMKRTISGFFFRFFPRFFPVITCHTPALMSYCKDRLKIPDRRLYYLAQGVSDEFLRTVAPEVPEGEPAARSIMYVATLGITSDFDDLLPMLARVFAGCKSATMTVVGDGARRSRFEARAGELGLSGRLVFTGRIAHADLPALMARHRIGLNYMRQSVVNDCRAILKIREYLACGLEVVCNDAGDAGLFSDHAYVERDIAAMERRLAGLLSNAGERNVSGRRFVEEHYSWQLIVDEFIRFLRSEKILPEEGGR
jgi:glycosyltransferase involved in cell wall biosynthesis